MKQLNLASVLGCLEDSVAAARWQQVTDPVHPNRGALINPELGVADPSHVGTVPFVAGGAYLYVARLRGAYSLHLVEGRELVARATAAADYLLRAQRPSGLIDLLSCNYDSSPDTAFAVQQLCTVLALGRPDAAHDETLEGLLSRLERFVRCAVPGIAAGGFHTPNHRWVIVSALAQAKKLFPDLDADGEVERAVQAYLAEGFDLDGEGLFTERSAGIYDAVSDRSLLLIAEHRGVPEARAAAEANLHHNLHLFHADGTADTGLSRRQDHGRALVPLCLATPYLYSAQGRPNPDFVAAASMLWESASNPSLVDLSWLSCALLEVGDPAPSPKVPPESYTYHLPRNGLWRVRRGLLSASFYRERSHLLTVRYGAAELTSLKIHQSFFGMGRFVGDRLEVDGTTAVFRFTGKGPPRRPGYDLPLGRPVPPEAWEEHGSGRAHRPLEPLESSLTVQEVEGGFDLLYRCEKGIGGVMTQIALDFPPGGTWETDDTCLRPRAGQVVFLKRGCGTMRYGSDALQIGPGANVHTTWAMRDAEAAPQHVRVLLTFVTPLEHAFSIRCWRGVGSGAGRGRPSEQRELDGRIERT